MEEVQDNKLKNVKPDSFYVDFYGNWILNPRNPYVNPTLEECIQIQINYDKMIDNNQFIKDLKYDISGRKEFFTLNNTFQKNKELLIKFEQNHLSYELGTDEKDLEFIELTKKLIKKCFLTLEQGYLITNQLFILNRWFGDDDFEEDIEMDLF